MLISLYCNKFSGMKITKFMYLVLKWITNCDIKVRYFDKICFLGAKCVPQNLFSQQS
jgi:hypothetical protein